MQMIVCLLVRLSINLILIKMVYFMVLVHVLEPKKYENPAVCGLVDVTPSSAMYEGEPYSFIGRDSVRAWTNNEEGSFFSVDLKNYKVRPHAYTLKNSAYGRDA
eukprot:323708_1